MTGKNWIIENLRKNNLDKQSIYVLYDQYKEDVGSDCDLDTFKRHVRKYYELIADDIDIQDYDDESVLRAEAGRQKQSDLNAQLRKTSREQYRLYNSAEEIYTEYIDALKKVDLSKFKIKAHTPSQSKKVMIVQLSDLHMNEIIQSEEAGGNCYDFDIASKRLKKFIAKAIQVGKFEKITEMHLFMSADFINSSRRLGERMSMATSLANATLLAAFLLQQVIVDLSKHFNITVSAVSGNESRINEFFDSGTNQLSENFDHIIFESLRFFFSKEPIKFNDDKNLSQQVIKISDEFNALLLHGNNIKSPTNANSSIAKMLQNYAYRGIRINGVFYGHFHESAIGDFVSRSSSLCGSNAYSNQDLGFVSRASQNIYIVEGDGYSAMKVDLQNVDGVEGYDIIELLERYTVRSSNYNSTVTIKNLV